MSDRDKICVFFFVIAVCGVSAGFLVYVCQDAIPPTQAELIKEMEDLKSKIAASPMPDLKLVECEPKDISVPVFKEGRLHLVLIADRVIYRGTEEPTFLIKPRVKRYDPRGVLISSASGDTGTIVASEGLAGMELDTLTLSGKVEVRQYESPFKKDEK